MSFSIDDLCREIAEKTVREGMEWKLLVWGQDSAIRTASGPTLCPLAYVVESGDYEQAAIDRLGMPPRLVAEVMDAADSFHGLAYIRAKLLRATGLA